MFEDDDRDIASIVFTLIFIGLAGIAAWRLITHLPNVRSLSITPNAHVPSPSPGSPPPSSAPKTIVDRCRELGIRQELFTQWMQEQTDQNAEMLLERLETLSPESRSGMGTYRRASYDVWLSAQSTSVSRRSLEVLADAQFVSWFPKQRGKTLNPRTLGQIWYAIVRDQIHSSQVKKATLDSSHAGVLNNGKGHIYQLPLQQGQRLKVMLTPPDERLSLWIFPPDLQVPSITKNSAKRAWVGQVNQAGTYEIVITSNNTKAFDYRIEFDNAK